jgi:hypothetical protein
MADAEQDVGGETQVTETSDSGSGTATDFTQVKPLSESEDPAHANFLPTEGHDVPEGLMSDKEGEES